MSHLTRTGEAVLPLLKRGLSWSRAHPDLLAILLIVTTATLLRAALMFRMPVLYVVASRPYYQAALQLFYGQEMTALSVRRVPGYTFFLMGIIWLFGVDPQAIAFVQHALGVGSAVLCYFIGKAAINRWVGLAAGLMAGLNSTLVVYEQQILSEPLFVFLFLLSIYLLVAAARGRTGWLFVAAGAVVGLASLTRILAQVVLLAGPPALWLYYRRFRPALVGSLLLGAGFVLTAAPWIIRNSLMYSETNLANGGSPLLSTMMHERPYTRGFFAPDNPRDPDPVRYQARRIVERMAPSEPDPLEIWDELRARLDLSPADANRIMGEIALETMSRHPWHYVQVYAQKIGNLFALPHDEPLQTYLSRTNSQWPGRYISEAVKDGTLPDLKPSTPSIAHRWEYGRATEIADFFKPTRAAPLLAVLFIVGLLGGVLRPEWRLILVPGLMLLGSIVVTGIVVGDKARYRYVLDPLIGIVAMGGVATLFHGGALLARFGLARFHAAQPSAHASQPVR